MKHTNQVRARSSGPSAVSLILDTFVQIAAFLFALYLFYNGRVQEGALMLIASYIVEGFVVMRLALGHLLNVFSVGVVRLTDPPRGMEDQQ